MERDIRKGIQGIGGINISEKPETKSLREWREKYPTVQAQLDRQIEVIRERKKKDKRGVIIFDDPISPKEDPIAPKEDPISPRDPIR
jgi:hypothetical protein